MTTKVERLQPLTHFSQLQINCSIEYLDDSMRERTLDEALGLVMHVSHKQGEDCYRLCGHFFTSDQYVRQYAVSGEYQYLDLVINCRFGSITTPLCVLQNQIARSQFAELLPMGRGGRNITASQRWTLETPVCMARLPEQEEKGVIHTLNIHVERRRQDFFMRQIELYLPCELCDEWFQKAVLLQRQYEAGLTATAMVTEK